MLSFLCESNNSSTGQHSVLSVTYSSYRLEVRRAENYNCPIYSLYRHESEFNAFPKFPKFQKRNQEFHNKPHQATEFICRFYHIFQGYSNKNLYFLHIKLYSNSFAIKRGRKSVNLSPKSFFQTSKQRFAMPFLPATFNVCPPDDPRVLCANTGIRLLANQSFFPSGFTAQSASIAHN